MCANKQFSMQFRTLFQTVNAFIRSLLSRHQINKAIDLCATISSTSESGIISPAKAIVQSATENIKAHDVHTLHLLMFALNISTGKVFLNSQINSDNK